MNQACAKYAGRWLGSSSAVGNVCIVRCYCVVTRHTGNHFFKNIYRHVHPHFIKQCVVLGWWQGVFLLWVQRWVFFLCRDAQNLCSCPLCVCKNVVGLIIFCHRQALRGMLSYTASMTLRCWLSWPVDCWPSWGGSIKVLCMAIEQDF